MNLLGKIFIVLIFIMSILFMGFSIAVYATHRNWKDEVTGASGLQTQVRQARDKNEQLQAENSKIQNSLTHERASRREALAVLEARLTDLDKQLVAKRSDYDSVFGQQRTALSAVENSQSTLQRLNDEVDQLRGQIRTAQLDRDDQFKRVIELTDKLHQGESVLRELQRRNQQLMNQNGRMQSVLSANDLNEFSPVTEVPPSLDGLITATSGDKYVEVSLGADDGLQIGHYLDISRNGKYLGRVQVTRVNPDRAVGRVMKEFRKAPMQRGDRVQTKIG